MQQQTTILTTLDKRKKPQPFTECGFCCIFEIPLNQTYMTNLQQSRLPNVPGIYVIKTFIDDRMYIGSSVNIKDRYCGHRLDLKRNRHHNSILQHFVNKYGYGSIYFDVLELCSREELIEREQHYMDLYKPRFNVRTVADSNVGRVITEETREKIRAKLKGRKTNRGSIGYKHTPETIEKIRQGNIGKVRTPDAIKRSADNRKGFKHTEEVKKQMSESKKGRKQGVRSLEHCLAISRGKKGKPVREEVRLKRIGMTHTEETKILISKKKTGMKYGPASEERKRKISEAQKRHFANEETRKAWAEKCKKVWETRKNKAV